MESQHPFINIHTHNAYSRAISVYNLGTNFSQIKKHHLVSIGLHPWFIQKQFIDKQFVMLEQLASTDDVVAIGECGLDKAIELDFEIQKEIFIKQIAIAERVNKPIIVHCVKAFNDLIEIKKTLNIKVPLLVHGFNNNKHIADQLIKNNIYLSFGKALLESDSNATKVINTLPKDKLFLETDDSMYSIQEIYTIAAHHLNIHLEELKQLLFSNFDSLFKSNI